MAVSTSTIVFALATSVAFGLAIKDTLGDDPRRGVRGGDGDGIDEDDHDYEAALARAEERRRERMAEDAAREAREATEKAEQQAKLRSVFGAEPATLGPALGSVALGPGSSAELRTIDVGMELDAIGDTTLEGIALRPRYGEASQCGELEEDLQRVWGMGDVGTRGHYWINSPLAQRAALKTLSTVCELRIERFAAPAAWIDRNTSAVVPLWAVGRPTKELAEHLEQRASATDVDGGEDDEIRWTDTGLGPSGRGRTQLTAHVAKGRIAAITANSEVEVDTFDAAVAHLTKQFGAYTDDLTMVWKRAKPRLEVEIASGKLFVTAGKLPE